MQHSVAVVWLIGAVAGVAAAQGSVTTAAFSGTWNIEFMSHQIALVIEPKDATHVTATMMMPGGRDLALVGVLAGRTLTLTGDPAAAGAGASSADQAASGAPSHPPPARPIAVTLQDDGTIIGEMMTANGPGTWTGERLRKRK